MTVNDLANMRLLEIKMIAPAKLESICSQPRPDGQLGLRWDDARYALSLRRAPRRPY
jgi:hypothetical protein